MLSITSSRSVLHRIVVVTAVALLAASCGGDESSTPTPDTPTVMATTSIWADVTANIACDGLATVETIMPVAADPHAFEPSLADRAKMERADLIVANGLTLEDGLDDTLGAVEKSGVAVFRIAEYISSIVPSYPDGRGGTRADDPHVWFDPQRTTAGLSELAAQLVEHAGLDAAEVDACLERYREQLAGLDQQIEQRFATIPVDQRLLVTSHDSLGYLADRYGFAVLGAVIPAPSTLAEANPAQLERLATLIDDTKVKAIFAEDQHSTKDVDALAARVGDIEVVSLLTGNLGEPGSGSETYLGMLESNAALIEMALR